MRACTSEFIVWDVMLRRVWHPAVAGVMNTESEITTVTQFDKNNLGFFTLASFLPSMDPCPTSRAIFMQVCTALLLSKYSTMILSDAALAS